jgi:hypothetical protein
MFAIKSFSLNRNPIRILTGLLLCPVGGILGVSAQVVPVQANIDAQAQRRLQNDTQESLRRRRIDENIRRLVPVLDAENLTGTEGLPLIRQSLATIANLQKDNVPPRDALQEAIKRSSLDTATTQKTSTYLLECWRSVSEKLTADDLGKMEKGLEPRTPLSLPAFHP